MTVASGARGVVAAFGSFLAATALEDGAVQIEAEAFWRLGPGEREKPFPKWPPKLLNVALAKAEEEIAHGVGAGKTLDTQQSMESLVRPKPVGVGEAAGSGYHRDHEGHKGFGRRNGVGAVVGEGHQAADLPSQTDLLEESDEADKATEGGDRLGGGGEPDLPTREDSVTGILHRLVKGHELWLFDTTLLPHDL